MRRYVIGALVCVLALVGCSEEHLDGRPLEILTYTVDNDGEPEMSGGGDFVIENDCLLVISSDGSKLIPRFPEGTEVTELNGVYRLKMGETVVDLNQHLYGSMIELRQMRSTHCSEEGSLGLISVYSVTSTGPLTNSQ